jgi:hypothetical protein
MDDANKRDSRLQNDTLTPRSVQNPIEFAFVLLPREGGFVPSILTGWNASSHNLQSTQDSARDNQGAETQRATQSPVPVASPKTVNFDLEPTQSTAPTPGKQFPSRQRQQDDAEPVRFSMLPGDRRPDPVAPITDDDIEDEVNGPHVFIVPEPLSAPQVGKSQENPFSASTNGGRWQLPKSSLVPSYILAGTNRFSRSEIDDFMPQVRGFYNFGQFRQPLFVYGSFMFPSIVRNRAEMFTLPEGVYSQSNQRRLRCSSSDWSGIDLSLQHAAEKMTPAILRGYERWKPKDFSCAAIRGVRRSSFVLEESYEIKGFLIFGLSEEALKCCDELFSGDLLESAYRVRDRKQDTRRRASFLRENVPVTIVLKNGKSLDMNAVSYVWDEAHLDPRNDWNINAFVKSKTFRKLSGGGDETSHWMKEEKKLATTMKMAYVLPGDCLADAISRNSVDDVIELLDQGEDVDAPCQGYGSPLQAAVAKGNEEIVHLLLSYQPDVNTTGGMYGSALICATVLGDEEIARTLLKAGANVLTGDAQYVSPAYQAISHDDQDMVHLLMEDGAWLTRGYGELLDLATERNNKDIIRMLRDYDVRDIYLKRRKALTEESLSDSDSEDSRDGNRGALRRQTSRDKQVALKPGKVLRAVGIQALMLKGKPGKWTGIKGVRVMKAAIGAGVSPDLVDRIAPHLSDISRLIDFLRQAVYDLGDPKAQAKRLGGRSGRGRDDDEITIIELPESRGQSSVGRLHFPQSFLANETNAVQ